MKVGIRAKLTILAIGAVLAASVTSAILIYLQEREAIRFEAERSAKDIGSLTAASLISEINRRDFSTLRAKLVIAYANPDLLYAWVADNDGLVLSDVRSGKILRSQKPLDSFSTLMFSSPDWVTQVEGEMLKVGGPVRGADGRRAGYLQMGFSLTRMQDDLRDAIRAITQATILAVCIGVTLAFLLGTALSRPIRAIAEACRKIGAGDLDTRLSTDRSDELGAVADAVNTMARALERKIDQLKTTQAVNEAITATLDLTVALEILTEKIEALLPNAPVITVQLIDHGREELEYITVRNADATEWMREVGRRSPLSSNRVASAVIERGEILQIRNLRTDSRIRHKEYLAKLGAVSFLGLSLGSKNNVLGVLGVYIRVEHELLEEEIEVLRDLARQAGVAIQNARLYRAAKDAELALANKVVELNRSNVELDQFASVVSHDLQEPLRMVTAYVQLLQTQYAGKLDNDADEFIGYAVNGATRMQRLIDDLLTYSRVSTRGREFAATDCNVVLEGALLNLRRAIDESDAKVTQDQLPTVLGDQFQLGQLFQNLIANAIKYHALSPPAIHVGCERDGETWRFSVTDNGIGIDRQYAERIFVIFQRLHTRQEYPGTGIGLAICKKIVERHRGKIWVESKPGQGSTFYFSLPA